MTRASFSLGGVQDASNKSANPSRLVNCYIEALAQGSRATYTIRPVPGLEDFASLGTSLLRSMRTVNGYLYAVANGALYGIDSMGAVARLGAVADDESTTLSGNLDTVVITAGGIYHVWDGGSVTTPVGGAFTSVGSAEVFDFSTVMTERDGPNFQWSALADPSTLSGVRVARTESNPDNILRVKAVGRGLWLFGEVSTEIWPNSGVAGASGSAVFSSRLHSFEHGLLTPDTICDVNEALFFVGNDRVVYLTQGLIPRPLVHPGVETAIRDGEIDRCFYYEDAHHRFACIRFKDRPAWCFDIATGEWHERSSGVTYGAWEVLDTAYAYGHWFAASNSGQIYKMSRTGDDAGRVLRREITTLPAYFAGEVFRIKEIEVLGEFGVHDVGREARIMLRTSSDGGHTWAPPKDKRVGVPGTFRRRAVWKNMGMHRQLALQIAMTDPGDFALYSEGNIEIA